MDVVSVFVGVIYFGYESQLGVFLFDLRNYPSPELTRHHLCHVATETIDAFRRPEQQYVAHLLPSVGHRVKVVSCIVHIVYAIIQLHGFVPIVLVGPCVEAVVTGSLGGLFNVHAAHRVV